MLVQILRADAKMGLELQEVWGGEMHNKRGGRRSRQGNLLTKLLMWKERRKEDWVGRVSDSRVVLRKFQQGQWGLLELKSCTRGVSCPTGLVWPSTCTVLRHWLWSAWEKHGLSANVVVNAEEWHLEPLVAMLTAAGHVSGAFPWLP